MVTRLFGGLAVADDDLVHPEVDILDSQAAAFEEEDVPANPPDVGLLGAAAAVA